MEQITPKLLNWASQIEQNTLDQALRTSRLPFIAGHVALMPDAHLGFGATVGSVIPVRGAIIPAAVGVDLGCGMCAVETDVRAEQLPDSLQVFLPQVERTIPSGMGNGHATISAKASECLEQLGLPQGLSTHQESMLARQLGTLGSGNHFFEICLDERNMVWVVLHSGSRGIGNQLAERHIKIAKGLMKRWFIALEDPELAYLVQGTAEFDAYIRDMLWAQSYARANRDIMMDAACYQLFRWLGFGSEISRVNCHHNYAEIERHGGDDIWVMRKGAIRAREGDLGVIPGSMGASSYIVRGLGNRASYHSAAHGAGRLMSRSEAVKRFTGADLSAVMQGKVWLEKAADALVDEAPMAYKDIDRVMEDQKDLVEITHCLHQILNYKGIDKARHRKPPLLLGVD
ncbi:RtcB family protein [Candidatus Gottesmanbacteria bacterium]|nr:RtcB family protein [Candidatus Gottesmanbacteria bacterium]